MKTVINHARIITGMDQVIEDGSLQFEDGRITGINEEELDGDQVVDGSGKTIIPGLIDCHVHLGMEMPGRGFAMKAANDTELGARIMEQCLEFPRYGVTCVRNAARTETGICMPEICFRGTVSGDPDPGLRHTYLHHWRP